MLFGAMAAYLMLSHQVRLVAVGDVMLARWVGRRIEKEGVDSPFASVAPVLRGADLAVGNLECAVTTAPFAVRKPILLRASPAVVPALRRAGFSVLSLANNHAGDCGSSGLLESSSLLRSAGISSLLGSPAIVRQNGMRIGLIGFCDLPPGASFDAPVKALRPRVDVLVAMIHWGIEGMSRESPEQRSLASRLADDGVDLILGSHPHVLQPIQWVAGHGGRRCLVAYSLGNFVFDARPGLERQSEILSVVLGRSGVVEYSTIPIAIRKGYPAPEASLRKPRVRRR